MRGRLLMFAAGRKMGQAKAQQQIEQAETYRKEGAEMAQQQAESKTAPSTDVTTELQKLADLKKSGALTEEEFTAAKKKLLGI